MPSWKQGWTRSAMVPVGPGKQGWNYWLSATFYPPTTMLVMVSWTYLLANHTLMMKFIAQEDWHDTKSWSTKNTHLSCYHYVIFCEVVAFLSITINWAAFGVVNITTNCKSWTTNQYNKTILVLSAAASSPEMLVIQITVVLCKLAHTSILCSDSCPKSTDGKCPECQYIVSRYLLIYMISHLS